MHGNQGGVLEDGQSVGTSACFSRIARTPHIAVPSRGFDGATTDYIATEALLRILCSGYCILLTTAIGDAGLVGHLRAIGIVVACQGTVARRVTISKLSPLQMHLEQKGSANL